MSSGGLGFNEENKFRQPKQGAVVVDLGLIPRLLFVAHDRVGSFLKYQMGPLAFNSFSQCPKCSHLKQDVLKRVTHTLI